MYLYITEKSVWLVLDDNKHAGVQHGNTFLLLGEGAFAVKDCLVVPIKESILFQQLVVIGQDIVCFVR